MAQPTPTKERKLFFTTTDLIERLNSTVAEVSGEDAPANPKNNVGCQPQSQQRGFELQRRMPDGSSRKADEGDRAVADFQSKIKQTAAVLHGMSTEEKLDWAKAQRGEGNALFADREYREAMDVYVTCLVAMDKLKGSDIEENIEKEIQLPVLLNLALCALKMGMLNKAESFCNFAMETSLGRISAKAYFRRGKARMLMGMYKEAKGDLEKTQELLVATTDSSNHEADEAGMAAVEKEIKKLERLERMAKYNQKRQREAMKSLWGTESAAEKPTGRDNLEATPASSGEYATGSIATSTSEDENTQHLSADNGIYVDVKQRRQFSTLRKKKLNEESVDESEIVAGNRQWFARWYFSLFERCLRKTLRFLGDEEGAMTNYYGKIGQTSKPVSKRA